MVVILIGSIIFLVRIFFADPSKYLINNYYKHKTDFNNLVEMFKTDKGLERVGAGFTTPPSLKMIGLTNERFERYTQILSKLDLSDGIEGYDKKDIIWLHASSRGLAISGSSKGYVYTDNPSKYGKIVDNIENYISPDQQSFTIFQPIEGNWYIYFDYED